MFIKLRGELIDCYSSKGYGDTADKVFWKIITRDEDFFFDKDRFRTLNVKEEIVKSMKLDEKIELQKLTGKVLIFSGKLIPRRDKLTGKNIDSISIEKIELDNNQEPSISDRLKKSA